MTVAGRPVISTAGQFLLVLLLFAALQGCGEQRGHAGLDVVTVSADDLISDPYEYRGELMEVNGYIPDDGWIGYALYRGKTEADTQNHIFLVLMEGTGIGTLSDCALGEVSVVGFIREFRIRDFLNGTPPHFLLLQVSDIDGESGESALCWETTYTSVDRGPFKKYFDSYFAWRDAVRAPDEAD